MSGRFRSLPRPRSVRGGVAAGVLVLIMLVVLLVVAISLGGSDSESARAVGEFDDDFASGTELSSRWQEDGAAFVVEDGVARAGLVSGAGGVAVADLGQSSVLFTVDFDQVASGSGVVALFRDPQTYVKVVAVEEFATWNVYRVDGGQTTFLGTTGSFSFRGAPTRLEVLTVGGVLEVSIDGVLAATLPISEVLSGTGFGLLADPADGGATEWSAVSLSFAVPEPSS